MGAGQNSTGVLDVTGTGAKVDSNGYLVTVGLAGQGTMLVSQGGTVISPTSFRFLLARIASAMERHGDLAALAGCLYCGVTWNRLLYN